MSLIIDREPVLPGDPAPAAAATDHLKLLMRSIRMKVIGGTLIVFGVVAMTAFAFRVPNAACLVGGVAIALVVIIAWLTMSLLGDLAMWRGASRWAASIAKARDEGAVEVIRMDPDAAWR